jgi:hypothetical protein
MNASTTMYTTRMTTLTPQKHQTLLDVVTAMEAAISGIHQILNDADAESVSVPGQGEWNEQDLRRIVRLSGHLPGAQALLRATARRAGNPVSFTEVLTESGLDARHQRNEHAALSRVSRTLFVSKRWPIEVWQDHGSGEMQYRMHPRVAVWFRAIQKDEG